MSGARRRGPVEVMVLRGARIGLAGVLAAFTLLFAATALMTALLTLWLAMITGGLLVWMLQPLDTPPRPAATRLVGWGFGLLVAELTLAGAASQFT